MEAKNGDNEITLKCYSRTVNRNNKAVWCTEHFQIVL